MWGTEDSAGKTSKVRELLLFLQFFKNCWINLLARKQVLTDPLISFANEDTGQLFYKSTASSLTSQGDPLYKAKGTNW